MNFVGTTTYQGTKKDADELYSMFKDDLAKCTSSFEWAHIREGKMIFIANVTDEEKFYALFEDQRSKDWNAKFNAKDEAWKLEKIMQLDHRQDHFEINQGQQAMDEENRRKLWTLIKEAGDYLVGQLPDHPNHPKGRNPYAHVAICVKSKFNASYKDIPDDQLDDVIKYIEFLKENPS